MSALDKCNVWCDAVVTDERGQGSSRQLRVHYSGWNKRFDEWLFVSGGRLRAPPSGAPRPLPSPRAPRHSHRATPPRPASHYRSRHRHPCLTFVRWRRARPPARPPRAAHTMFHRPCSSRRHRQPGAVPPAPPAPRPAAAAAAAGSRRRRRRCLSRCPQAERRRARGEAAAAAEASAERRLHRCRRCRPIRRGAPPPSPPARRRRSRSLRPLRHLRLHPRRPPPGPAHLRAGRQAPAPSEEEPVEEEKADPRPTTTPPRPRPRARARRRRWRSCAAR